MGCKWICGEDIEFMACSVSILSLVICPGTKTDVTLQLFLGLHPFFNHNSSSIFLPTPQLLSRVITVLGTFPTLKISPPLSIPATGPCLLPLVSQPCWVFSTCTLPDFEGKGDGRSVCSSFPSSN